MNTSIEHYRGGEQKKTEESQVSKHIIPALFHCPLTPTWSATSYLEKNGHTIKIIYLVILFTMKICCSYKNLNNVKDITGETTVKKNLCVAMREELRR